MVCMAPLLAALYFGLLPELEAMRKPPVRGAITFPKARPVFKASADSPSRGGSSGSGSMDWLLDSYEGLMSWDKNPWKIPRTSFGSHFLQLAGSKDPLDIARTKEIRRLADALHQRVLQRYPELAVPDKNIPPERNGFLKLLELSERFDADPDRPGTRRCKEIGFPEDLKKQLRGESPWNPESVRNWLSSEKPLMDELHGIGLMPGQSIAGIELDRWSFISARFGKSCADALLMEARLAAEDGDAARAMESVQAANGFANHLGNVETPTLLAVTVQILIQMDIRNKALTEIMPALPSGQLDPAAWENAVNPTVSQPAEFARIMKGEWNVTAREYILPMVTDTRDPKYPPDPEALIDFHAASFVDVVRQHEAASLADLPNIEIFGSYDNSHLSRSSRQLTNMLGIGMQAWRKGWDRAQSAAAMTQAAFAIMKGQAVPNDPVYGLPYRWDAATRTLSAPDSPVFKEMGIKPLSIPKP